MKKTALTFVALAFGMGVAFAQTTPQTEDQPTVNTEESITTDKMSNNLEEAGRRAIQVEELPAAIQEALKSDDFKDFKVVAVAEVQAQADAPEAAAKQYEVALAQNEATEPSVLVLFDEKGQVVSASEPSTEKIEE